MSRHETLVKSVKNVLQNIIESRKSLTRGLSQPGLKSGGSHVVSPAFDTPRMKNPKPYGE